MAEILPIQRKTLLINQSINQNRKMKVMMSKGFKFTAFRGQYRMKHFSGTFKNLHETSHFMQKNNIAFLKIAGSLCS